MSWDGARPNFPDKKGAFLERGRALLEDLAATPSRLAASGIEVALDGQDVPGHGLRAGGRSGPPATARV